MWRHRQRHPNGRPPPTFAALDREFGLFDLDVAATAANTKCAQYYSEADDGLSQPWQGTVWLNPPSTGAPSASG
jgi:DNA N-6-adenine-methyltransferase (Dam)